MQHRTALHCGVDNTLSALTIEKFDKVFQAQTDQYASVFWSYPNPSAGISVDSNDYFTWPPDSGNAFSGFKFAVDEYGFLDLSRITNISQDGMFTITYAIAIKTVESSQTPVAWELVLQSTSCARSTGILTPSCFSGSCVASIQKGSDVRLQNLSTSTVTVTSASISICPI